MQLLQDRYWKPQHIISAHMEEIIKLPACTGERPSVLRYMYDKVTVNIRGLASMGINFAQYGSLLTPIIMTKLLQELRLRITRETDKDIWEIDELMTVIKREVEAREASEFVKLHQPKQSRSSLPVAPTVATPVTSSPSIRCIYCGEPHYSASCVKFRTPQERKAILVQSGRCFNCLKNNHKFRKCESSKTCRYCNHKHHQSICDKRNSCDAPASDHMDRAFANSNSNSGTSDNIGSSTEVVPTSTNTTSVSKKHQTVLLQTAHAVALASPNGPLVPVRVLFDSGSQLSYVTKRFSGS